MKKSDLKVGYVVETHGGNRYMLLPNEADGKITLSSGKGFLHFFQYTDDLRFIGQDDNYYDIDKVYGYCELAANALRLDIEDRPLLWERKDEPKEQPTAHIANLNDFAKEVYENATAHGWYDGNRTFGDVVALCHSELSEALEEYRSGNPLVYYINDVEIATDMNAYHGEKLEGVATEMIDCIIRILDWCGANDIDVENLLRLKHEYNKTRPYKHGGKIL